MKTKITKRVLKSIMNTEGGSWEKLKMGYSEKYFIILKQIAILNSIYAEDRTKVLIEIMENQKLEKENVRNK